MADLLKHLKTSPDIVDGNEEVYRRIHSGRNLYSYIEGKVVFSSEAFLDPKMQPSVDRAKLRSHNPKNTQSCDTDGVVSLLTKDIRSEKIGVGGSLNITEYNIDVIADPSKNNQAHAIIIPAPEYKNKNAFRKVRARLAYLATKRGWILAPKQ